MLLLICKWIFLICVFWYIRKQQSWKLALSHFFRLKQKIILLRTTNTNYDFIKLLCFTTEFRIKMNIQKDFVLNSWSLIIWKTSYCCLSKAKRDSFWFYYYKRYYYRSTITEVQYPMIKLRRKKFWKCIVLILWSRIHLKIAKLKSGIWLILGRLT